MPFIEAHYTWYGCAATDVQQPHSPPRIFKSHMTLNELQKCDLAPPYPDASDEGHTQLLVPSSSLQYARIIYCMRGRDDVLVSWYRFVPAFVHVHPDWIPFDSFVHWWFGQRMINEKNRLQSLVDCWRLRHHPHIFVCVSIISHISYIWFNT
jgi:hypothetical protein